MSIVLEQLIGDGSSDGEGFLTSVIDADVDDNGDLYVYDRVGGLFSFSSDGTLRWSVGRFGDGPGEFRNVRSVRWDGSKYIYVSNLGGARIDRFAQCGAFVDSHPSDRYFEGEVSLVGFLDPENLIVSTRIRGAFGVNVYSLHSIDDWRVDTSFSIDQTDDRKIPSGIGTAPELSIIGNAIVVGHVTKYSYTWYNKYGVPERRVTKSGVSIEPPHIFPVTGGVSLARYGGLYAPLRLDETRWIGGGRWPINIIDADEYEALRAAGNAYPLEYTHTLDVYNDRGQLLYTFSETELSDVGFFRPIATDARRGIYAQVVGLNSPLGRFRVQY